MPEILRSKVMVLVDLFKRTEKVKRQAGQLEAINREMENEIARRRQAEKEIKQLNETLERRIVETTAVNREPEALQ
ncbi:MAG: hypothetical protein HYY20_05385 [Candidatus Tectomicrobia bacterium]|uniref:Uncharacterized protein n=1 Tax=Tectimicrobiota bacterium TaxID=2528274 RepID=A0A932CMT6_UNCTE|nr:hypothetical protein [Candidatus Tectomicrobia bacterium]